MHIRLSKFSGALQEKSPFRGGDQTAFQPMVYPLRLVSNFLLVTTYEEYIGADIACQQNSGLDRESEFVSILRYDIRPSSLDWRGVSWGAWSARSSVALVTDLTAPNDDHLQSDL